MDKAIPSQILLSSLHPHSKELSGIAMYCTTIQYAWSGSKTQHTKLKLWSILATTLHSMNRFRVGTRIYQEPTRSVPGRNWPYRFQILISNFINRLALIPILKFFAGYSTLLTTKAKWCITVKVKFLKIQVQPTKTFKFELA